MIKEERLARLEDYVLRHKYAGVEELVQCLEVSRATVRRDLNQLAEEGRILLTRGGGMALPSGEYGEQPYREKKETNAALKERIGRVAAAMIPEEGGTVIIDAGTTTRAMLPFLRERAGISLLTNDVAIASDLANCHGIQITVTGGQMRPDFYTLRGYLAEETVRQIQAQLAFIGMDAVDPVSGCYIANADEVGVKRQIIRSADRVVALCDHEKLARHAYAQVCSLSEIDVLVTTREADPHLIQGLRDSVPEVVLA